MARKHARLLVSIWDDADFTALEPSSQIVYFAILSSRDLSWAGVNPLLPQRFTTTAKGMTEKRVRNSLDTLAAARFLVIDESTAEVAVRTFVRHDEILQQPNVTKAMGRAFDLIRSHAIRKSVVTELTRAFKDDPEAKGWPSLQVAYPDLFRKVCEKALPNPSANPSGNPFTNPSTKAS